METMKIGKDWIKTLADNGITLIDTRKDLVDLLDQGGVLITSRCSKTKGIAGGFPKDLYISPLNQTFYQAMEKNNYYYGILSDLYGLHLCDEELGYYDVHPSMLKPEEFERLGKLIREKADLVKMDKILFYNTSPIMSSPYFKMMSYTGLKIYFITKISLFDKPRPGLF